MIDSRGRLQPQLDRVERRNKGRIRGRFQLDTPDDLTHSARRAVDDFGNLDSLQPCVLPENKTKQLIATVFGKARKVRADEIGNEADVR
jgi:hypothetical protein